MDETTFERFMKFVNKTDDCWLWTGGKKDGYGRFMWNGFVWNAHRLSYIHSYGNIPDGLIVRHKCKNKCVNPSHLELGTKKQNAEDRKRDGTELYGVNKYSAKLTPEQVIEIRASNKTQRQLAAEYGVANSTIWFIKQNLKWKNI